jgi:hypothetical protein
MLTNSEDARTNFMYRIFSSLLLINGDASAFLARRAWFRGIAYSNHLLSSLDAKLSNPDESYCHLPIYYHFQPHLSIGLNKIRPGKQSPFAQNSEIAYTKAKWLKE